MSVITVNGCFTVWGWGQRKAYVSPLTVPSPLKHESGTGVVTREKKGSDRKNAQY